MRKLRDCFQCKLAYICPFFKDNVFIFIDRNQNTKKMKIKRSLFILILIAIFLIPATGCKVVQPHRHSKSVIFRSNPSGKVPPGQLKKATGAKSAKEYAPGQNKKKK